MLKWGRVGQLHQDVTSTVRPMGTAASSEQRSPGNRGYPPPLCEVLYQTLSGVSA